MGTCAEHCERTINVLTEDCPVSSTTVRYPSLTTIMRVDVFTSVLCTCRRTVQTAVDAVHTVQFFTQRVLLAVDLYRISTQ